MRRAVSLVFAALVLASVTASAQDCAEGRERVGGRCCWPGQTWSDDRARCEGAPRCPAPLLEHGDACVATTIAGGYDDPSGVDAPGLVLTDGWPLREGSEHPPRARVVTGRGEDEPLIALACAIFDIGWSLGMMGGALDELQDGGWSWPLSFIPLVGGMMGGLVDFAPSRGFSGFGFGFGIPSIIFQGVGLFFLLPIALANDTTERSYQTIDTSTSPRVELSASPGGLRFGVRF